MVEFRQLASTAFSVLDTRLSFLEARTSQCLPHLLFARLSIFHLNYLFSACIKEHCISLANHDGDWLSRQGNQGLHIFFSSSVSFKIVS